MTSGNNESRNGGEQEQQISEDVLERLNSDKGFYETVSRLADMPAEDVALIELIAVDLDTFSGELKPMVYAAFSGPAHAISRLAGRLDDIRGALRDFENERE